MRPALPSDQPSAAELIDEFLADGEVFDVGSFTLDRAASASKMYAFRYTDRSLYLLPLIEGVHGLGATEVTITPRGPDLILDAAGVSLPDAVTDLSNLYDHAVGSPSNQTERALARLGVGLDMALGFDAIERVGMVYTAKRETIAAEFRQRKSPRFVRLAPDGSASLKILIDRPFTSGLRPNVSQTELRHLREAVRHSERPVLLDGESISQQARSGTWARRGRIGPSTYEAFLTDDDGEPSVVELWTGGVCVDVVKTKWQGLHAQIHLDAPERDVSQMRIVRDATVKTALDELEHIRAELEGQRADRRLENEAWETQRAPQATPVASLSRLVVAIAVAALLVAILIATMQ